MFLKNNGIIQFLLFMFPNYLSHIPYPKNIIIKKVKHFLDCFSLYNTAVYIY